VATKDFAGFIPISRLRETRGQEKKILKISTAISTTRAKVQ